MAPAPNRYAITRRQRTESGRPAASIRFRTANADGRLGLLGGEANVLVAEVRSAPCSGPIVVSNERPFPIVCCFLPGQPSFLVIISRSRSTLFEGSTCSPLSTAVETRWDHDLNIIAVRRNGVVGGSAIISAVSCYPRDPAFNLI